MTVTIRPATAADRPTLIGLKHLINRAEHDAAPESGCARPILDLSLEAAEAGIGEYEAMLADSSGDWFVAELDGAVVGCALWVKIEARAAFKPAFRSWGLVMGVAVDPVARGRGVGAALMATMEDAIKAAGCSHAFLEVTAANAPAKALYQSGGYQPLEIAMLKPLD